MIRPLAWLWKTGIVSTFLAGFFVVLPIAITFALMGWAGNVLADWVGPGAKLGEALRAVGLRFVANETVAWVIGWAIVLAAIWALGVLVKSMSRHKLDEAFRAAVERIPVFNILYKPVAQVVGMLKRDGGDMKGMNVVYCAFGAEGGAGILGLLASDRVYCFNGRQYQIVYVPTSPVPMSGGILFVPAKSVHKVDMRVDDLMQIYFSIGVMSSKVIPERYVATAQPD